MLTVANMRFFRRIVFLIYLSFKIIFFECRLPRLQTRAKFRFRQFQQSGQFLRVGNQPFLFRPGPMFQPIFSPLGGGAVRRRPNHFQGFRGICPGEPCAPGLFSPMLPKSPGRVRGNARVQPIPGAANQIEVVHGNFFTLLLTIPFRRFRKSADKPV